MHLQKNAAETEMVKETETKIETKMKTKTESSFSIFKRKLNLWILLLTLIICR